MSHKTHNVVPFPKSPVARSGSSVDGNGGGDGTNDGMETRVAKLEVLMEQVRFEVTELRKDVRGVKNDVSDLKQSFARIDERVLHLPSKAFIFTVAIGIVTAMTAVLVFAQKLRVAIGV